MNQKPLADTLADMVGLVDVTESEWSVNSRRECSQLAHVMRPTGIS